jgi:hypothetical protein
VPFALLSKARKTGTSTSREFLTLFRDTNVPFALLSKARKTGTSTPREFLTLFRDTNVPFALLRFRPRFKAFVERGC